MAIGLAEPGRLHPVAGIRIATVRAGIKVTNKRDLVLFEIAEGSAVAGVFTTNSFCAAPVIIAKKHLQDRTPRYFIINTGFANAGTGISGMRDGAICCEQLARVAGCEPEEVLPFSTGVIGEPLPTEKITARLPQIFASLTNDGWNEAAYGIMTTDTVAKGISRQLEISGKIITVTGIAKGSGMICPNMATMLAFVATDAGFTSSILKKCLKDVTDASFNKITVDGDTSTNDACMIVATGASQLIINDINSESYRQLYVVIESIFKELSEAIIRDGEGATKFVTINITEGKTTEECRKIAYTIAHSPLVKTAIYGADPNWGRILAAIGRAEVSNLDINNIEIYLNDVCIVRNGSRAVDYREEQGKAVMGQPDIVITVRLGRGNCSSDVWTCDFSYDYVRINADYRS